MVVVVASELQILLEFAVLAASGFAAWTAAADAAAFQLQTAVVMYIDAQEGRIVAAAFAAILGLERFLTEGSEAAAPAAVTVAKLENLAVLDIAVAVAVTAAADDTSGAAQELENRSYHCCCPLM